MRLVGATFLLLLAFVSAEFAAKTEEEFVKASERCFKSLEVPSSYEAKFRKFEYPDEPLVHRYLRCVWMNLELWDDKNGFNVEHAADLYKDRANVEVLIPILSECNNNRENDPTLKWLYRGFQCILDSRVGGWFKEDVIKHVGKS